jgi:GntR family transcriptional regulator
MPTTRPRRRYLRVAERLRDEISRLEPSTRLPSERDLERRFRVSRATVRAALALLERSGLVSRQQGRGTTVSPPKVIRSLTPLYSIEEDLRRQGAKWETRVLRFDRGVAPSPSVRRSLRLSPDERVAALALLRLVEGRVIAYDQRCFPPAIAARFDPILLGDRAITEIVGQIAGAPITGSETDTEIVASTRDVAEALGITPGTLILTNTATHYLDDGVPAQHVVVSYRVDRVRFRSLARYARPQA